MYGYDAISANVGAISPDAPYVFGYVSGSAYIVWNQEDFNRFHSAHFEYIDQGNGTPWREPTILDVENGAITPQSVPFLSRKYGGAKVYCNQSTIPAVYGSGYRGLIWVAAPGSDASQVAHNVETTYPGLTVFAVQDQWNTTYDRSTILIPPAGPTPAPVEHIDIQGFNVRKPGGGIVPAVVSWWGTDGVVTREANIPSSLWDQIKWSK